MPKTEVLQWIDDLTLTKASQAVCADLYDQVVIDLASDRDRLWFGHFTLTAAALDEEIKFVPDDLVRIHQVFYDEHALTWETQRSMEALDPTWRNRRHTPVAYITDNVDDRQIRLWPPSDINCEELGWLYSRCRIDTSPDGINFDQPSGMDMPLAFLVLAREYSRESPHRDMTFAGICEGIGQRMLTMVEAR